MGYVEQPEFDDEVPLKEKEMDDTNLIDIEFDDTEEIIIIS